jgi:hypothetical protein
MSEFRKTLTWQGWKVTIRLREVEGRMEPVEFTVEGKKLDAQGLRGIPFARLVDRLRREYAKGLRDMAKGGKYLGSSEAVSAKTVARARRALRSVPPFEEVAQVYSTAYQAGLPATRAVADRWGVSRTAAAKWVARTREKGLLPATVRGQAKARPTKGGR